MGFDYIIGHVLDLIRLGCAKPYGLVGPHCKALAFVCSSTEFIVIITSTYIDWFVTA